MDKMRLANNLSRIENLIPKAPPEIKKSLLDQPGATSFEETLTQVTKGDGAQKPELLKNEDLKPALKFSNHAVERMQTRGISYNPERLQKLDDAIKKAAAKGSKDTLVLMDDSALIVSVKNNTVVTVMDKNSLRENVFTNIDSTVVI
jgi:flagellar operon protein